VVRIKDGMEFIKIQEETYSRIKRAQSATFNQYASKFFKSNDNLTIDASQINKKIDCKNYKQVISSHYIGEDFKESATANSKLKKIKEQNKKNSGNNPNEIKKVQKGNKFNKKISFFNKDFDKIAYTKRDQTPDPLKRKIDLNENLKSNFNYKNEKNISKFEEIKKGSSHRKILFPNKVVELFSQIKNVSNTKSLNNYIHLNSELFKNNNESAIFKKDNVINKSTKHIKHVSNLENLKSDVKLELNNLIN